MTIGQWLDLEDIKTFFSKQIVKMVVFIQKIIHIQKVILAHMANVLGCHSFWWILYVFFAQFPYISFHGRHLTLIGLYDSGFMQRIITEGEKNRSSPLSEAAVDPVLLF